MDQLLFVGYLMLFAWAINNISFFKNSGITSSQLAIAFLLKVMAGIFYGWVGVYYGELAKMQDTWSYHYESINELKLLLNDPYEFFASLIRNPYQDGYGKFFSSENSWWNDLDINLFIKLLAIFNLFSGGSYFINVIFYSFITLYGPIAFYKVMADIYPAKKYEILLITFLLPSFIYWTSGIHKEGYIFLGFSLILYHIYFGFKEKRWPLRRWLAIALGFVLILALRNFLLILLIPALFAWIISKLMAFKTITVFSICYLFFTIFFFTAKYINPKLDFPEAVVEKQQAFMKLSGSSFVETTELKPNAFSFLVNIPEAINLSLLRPFPSDVKHLLSMAAAVEINLLILLFLIFIFYHTNLTFSKPFIYFCVFFSLSVFITIGYTVNFLGAIVRYRSVVLPFLVVPAVANINWDKLNGFVLKYITNNYNE